MAMARTFVALTLVSLCLPGNAVRIRSVKARQDKWNCDNPLNDMFCNNLVRDETCSGQGFGCAVSQVCPNHCSSVSTTMPPSPTPSPPTPSAPTPSPPGANDGWGMPCDTTNDCCSPTLCPGFTAPSGDTVTGHRPYCQCSNGCRWGIDCGRDAVVAANNYFQPDRHCGGGGHCEPGSWTDAQDSSSARECLVYNNGRFVRELSPAGYCMGIYEKAYADFVVTVNARTASDFEDASRWFMDPANQADSTKLLSCTADSFCLGHGTASGDIGSCQCTSADAASIEVADLDRFSSILDSECTDLGYCAGRGTATFSSGTCSCACHSGYSGNHCELADGESCTDFEDCFGHGIASGTRPNCRCDCNVPGLASTHQFTGSHCANWAWGTSGVYEHQLSVRSASSPATSAPTPATPTPTPASTAGTCMTWCAKSMKPWTKKCKWSKCAGCSGCR